MDHIARDKRDHEETIVRAIALKPHKRLLALGIVVLALCLIAPASAFAEESRRRRPRLCRHRRLHPEGDARGEPTAMVA
jgi:hypothetical protein